VADRCGRGACRGAGGDNDLRLLGQLAFYAPSPVGTAPAGPYDGARRFRDR
jgi:hypothetical protein